MAAAEPAPARLIRDDAVHETLRPEEEPPGKEPAAKA